MKLATVSILSLLCMNCFAQQNEKSWKAVNYGRDTMVYQNADIYPPEKPEAKYPAVVVIYGSAWFGNNFKGMGKQTLGKPLLHADKDRWYLSAKVKC